MQAILANLTPYQNYLVPLVLVLILLVMLFVIAELRALRQAAAANAKSIQLVADVGRQLVSRNPETVPAPDPVRFAGALLLASRRGQGADAESIAREVEVLVENWDELDREIGELLDEIDAHRAAR